MVFVKGKAAVGADYYIGKYEVTQKLWYAVMGSNPSGFVDSIDNFIGLPVENVSWYDCIDFISKLNTATGLKFRLPTEKEWEFAANGGVSTFEYSGSNNCDEVAWFADNAEMKTHSVGRKKPNSLGIYDMSGNVWEWVSDSNGDYKVNKGGCWYSSAEDCKPSIRRDSDPQNKFRRLGFRLLLEK